MPLGGPCGGFGGFKGFKAGQTAALNTLLLDVRLAWGVCGGFGGFKRFKGFKAGQMAALNTLKNSWTWPVLAAAGRV